MKISQHIVPKITHFIQRHASTVREFLLYSSRVMDNNDSYKATIAYPYNEREPQDKSECWTYVDAHGKIKKDKTGSRYQASESSMLPQSPNCQYSDALPTYLHMDIANGLPVDKVVAERLRAYPGHARINAIMVLGIRSCLFHQNVAHPSAQYCQHPLGKCWKTLIIPASKTLLNPLQ